MLQRVLLGPVNERLAGIPDINKRELLTLVPLMIVTILIGVYPLAAIKYQMVSIEALIKVLGGMSF
jgi:NADH-quinone oxidoreductase subunit M